MKFYPSIRVCIFAAICLRVLLAGAIAQLSSFPFSKSESQLRLAMKALLVMVLTIGILFLSTPLTASAQDVPTQHNNNQRTGAYLNETRLNPSNVQPGSFGLLNVVTVDGQIAAQPLYVEHVRRPDATFHDMLYVATRTNHVFAFDTNGTQLWHACPDAQQCPGAGNMPPSNMALSYMPPPEKDPITNTGSQWCNVPMGPIGVLSTPVIDVPNATMFLVARDANYKFYLYALDIATGARKNKVEITYTPPGPGGPSFAFNPTMQGNRPGLLLAKGRVYVAFAAIYCDNGPVQGWIFAYDAATLNRVAVFSTVPEGGYLAGIWQSGQGLATDPEGNIYAMTGNGAPSNDTSLENSFLKLDGDLNLTGYFKPNNWRQLNTDIDLGSGGPVVLPDGRIVGGGKQGRLYVLDGRSMSTGNVHDRRLALVQHRGEDLLPDDNGCSQPAYPDPHWDDQWDGLQAAWNTFHIWAAPECQVAHNQCRDHPDIPTFCPDSTIFPGCPMGCYVDPKRYGGCPYGQQNGQQQGQQFDGPNIHGGAVFWNNGRNDLLFTMAEKDYLRSFRYDHATGLTPYSISGRRTPDGMPGAALSVSANGNKDGIVWASMSTGDSTCAHHDGILVAFDATTLNELWADTEGGLEFAKFTPPTIAHGRVYRATWGGKLMIYGLLTHVCEQPPAGCFGDTQWNPDDCACEPVCRRKPPRGGCPRGTFWHPDVCACKQGLPQ